VAGVGAGIVAGVGAGAGAAGLVVGAPVAAIPARHFSTKALSVIPALWFSSLFARHSSRHALTVFC